MENFLIALLKLNINNHDIEQLLNFFSLQDFKDLFNGEYIKLQFKYNINLDSYSSIFSNISLLNAALDYSDFIIKQNKLKEISTISILDRDYPNNLKYIDNKPLLLYYKGNRLNISNSKSIACIGSRNCTKFGENSVKSIIPPLIKEGFCIVSGLAEGIDSLSHTTTLINNGKTIGVLASGLDQIYPSTNKNLANAILNKGGTLITEYPIGTDIQKFNFINRNRIITGLCKGTIFFEGRNKSGSMHSVRYTLKNNKPVFVPFTKLKSPTTNVLIELANSNLAIPLKKFNHTDTILKSLMYSTSRETKVKEEDIMDRIKMQYLLESVNYSKTSSKELNDSIILNVNKSLYKEFQYILNELDINTEDFINFFIENFIETHSTF